jgi:hypothetical protein
MEEMEELNEMIEKLKVDLEQSRQNHAESLEVSISWLRSENNSRVCRIGSKRSLT